MTPIHRMTVRARYPEMEADGRFLAIIGCGIIAVA